MPTRPTRTATRPTAWSLSALHQFEECGLRYKLGRIERRPTTRGPALERGDKIHKEGEAFLKAGGKLPDSYKLFSDEMKWLRKLGALSEAAWAFDRAWQHLNDWFHPNTWVRVKLDSAVETTMPDGKKKLPIVHVIDFKTGRIYEGYGEQLELYAITAFAKYPHVNVVAPALWFLDQGEIVGGPNQTFKMRDVPVYFTRSETEPKRAQWTKRATRMLTAKEKDFVPRPGEHCRFCDFSKAKGGPCRF